MRKSERLNGKKLHEGNDTRHAGGYYLFANKASGTNHIPRDVPDGSDDPKPPPKKS